MCACVARSTHRERSDEDSERRFLGSIVSVSALCEHVFVTATAIEPTTAQRMRAVEAELRDIMRAFEPDEVPVVRVVGLVAQFDAIERLGASGKTLLARRMEETGAWKSRGLRSAAEHLARVSGTSVSAAKRTMETSRQIDALPATAAAVRGGELSMAKVEIVAGAATIAPEAEAALLEMAASLPLAELREQCLRARAKDRDAAHERIKRDRSAREYTDAEGAWHFHARGTSDDGARFRSAFEPIVEEMFKVARTEGRRESREAYAFDALIELARRGTEPRNEPVKMTSTAPRFMGLVRVDHAALVRGHVEGDEVCEIAGLGPIPVHVARELLGDAIVKLVITKGVDVANVTHLGRKATIAQQVALWWRDPECPREGCTRAQRLEIDHRNDWVKTKHTRIDDLDRLCGHDHDLKTNHGWALVEGTGKRPMVPPDDPRHPRNKPPPDP
jgi:hypothetical protein